MKKIFLSAHRKVIFTGLFNDSLDTINELFCDRNSAGQCVQEPKIYTSLDFNHKPDVEKFEAIYQSDFMVILPAEWTLDSGQKWDMKLFEALVKTGHQKELRVVLPGRRLVKATLVNGELCPQKLIQDVFKRIPKIGGE